MVNKRVLAGALAFMGCALLLIGTWQLNQWYTTQVQAASTMSMLQGSLSSLGSEAGVQETVAALNSTTTAFLTTGIIDFVLGLVLLVAGLFLYPEGHF